MTGRYEGGAPALIRGTPAFNAVLRSALEDLEIPIEHQGNLALAIAFVKKSSVHIAIIHQEMRLDYRVVLAAVSKNGRAFGHVSIGYRDDRDITLAAIRSYAKAFEWASDELRADREVALAAVKIKSSMYEHVAQVLKDDVNFNIACARVNRDMPLILVDRAFIGFYDMINSNIAHHGMVAKIVNCNSDGMLQCLDAMTGESIMSFQLGAHMTYGKLATVCCTILGVDHVYLVFGGVVILPTMISHAIVL